MEEIYALENKTNYISKPHKRKIGKLHFQIWGDDIKPENLPEGSMFPYVCLEADKGCPVAKKDRNFFEGICSRDYTSCPILKTRIKIRREGKLSGLEDGR